MFFSIIVIHLYMILHCIVEEQFCRYCLQAFSAEKMFKCHVKNSFKVNGKQIIQMPKKVEYVRFKNNERKLKPPFVIYADFESVLSPKENGQQNPDESYTNKYQKHVSCSYGYKLECVDDKFSKPFKSYLCGDAVENFINSIIKEIKYYTGIMEKKLTINF